MSKDVTEHTRSGHSTLVPFSLELNVIDRANYYISLRCFLYVYIYIWSPPPHDPPTSILYGNYQCFMHIFFTRKMTFSCFYFFYLLRKSPTQTHTHMQFCFCLLFFHFLRFWSKTQKTLRKPKKTKKTKLQDPCRYKLVS